MGDFARSGVVRGLELGGEGVDVGLIGLAQVEALERIRKALQGQPELHFTPSNLLLHGLLEG